MNNQPTERVKKLLNPMLLALPNEEESKFKIWAQKPEKVRVIDGCAMAGEIRLLEHFHGWDLSKDDFSGALCEVIDAIRRNPELTNSEIVFMLERLDDSTFYFCPYGLLEDTQVRVKHLYYEVLEQ